MTTKIMLKKAIDIALLRASQEASSIFTSPKNCRSYGCSSPGCLHPAMSNGLCNAHYIRSRKGAAMSPPVRARKRADHCEFCGVVTDHKGGWGLCQKHYRQKRYEIIKTTTIKLMGSTCKKCGGGFPNSVFDFHHRKKKTGNPSHILANQSSEKIAEELIHCDLLCANCHRLEHSNEFRDGYRESAIF